MTKINFKIRNLLVTLSCTTVIFYLCYHMITGERGVLAFFRLNKEITKLHNELDTVRAERLNLEHKANLLKSESLDLDLLEEQAKSVLGYAKPQENILILEQEK